jgi:hypothetical protein
MGFQSISVWKLLRIFRGDSLLLTLPLALLIATTGQNQ